MLLHLFPSTSSYTHLPLSVSHAPSLLRTFTPHPYSHLPLLTPSHPSFPFSTLLPHLPLLTPSSLSPLLPPSLTYSLPPFTLTPTFPYLLPPTLPPFTLLTPSHPSPSHPYSHLPYPYSLPPLLPPFLTYSLPPFPLSPLLPPSLTYSLPPFPLSPLLPPSLAYSLPPFPLSPLLPPSLAYSLPPLLPPSLPSSLSPSHPYPLLPLTYSWSLLTVSEASLDLVLFNKSFSAAKGARCLDGSPGGFYLYRGKMDTKWIIFLEGVCVWMCARTCVFMCMCVTYVQYVRMYVHLFFTRYVLYMEETVSVSHWCVSV